MSMYVSPYTCSSKLDGLLTNPQVSNVTLLSMNQDISFTKDVRSTADVYEIA